MGISWQLCGRTEKRINKESPKLAPQRKVGGIFFPGREG